MTFTGCVLGVLFVLPFVLGVARVMGIIGWGWTWILAPWFLFFAIVITILVVTKDR